MRSRKRNCRPARAVPALIESMESRLLLSATVTEFEGVAYFLGEALPEVARYDIENEEWLSTIPLTTGVGLPSAFHVDSDGLYAAFGRTVYRYDSDGSNPTHLLNVNNDVIAIHSDGNLLFINNTSGLYTRATSIDKSTNTIIDTIDDYLDTLYGSSMATEQNRIFGRSGGTSPSDITFLSYDDAGNFLSNGDSRYHGDYPYGSQTWVFPDNGKVVDSSGTIYSTDSLTYLGTFGGAFNAMDFIGGEIPVVLSGNTVTVYTSATLPAGSKTLEADGDEIFVNDTNAIVFTYSSGAWETTTFPLSELSPPDPGEPVDPVGVPYTPDKTEVTNEGIVLLYSKSHQSIFQYDTERQTYVETIPLIGSAEFMAYSEHSNTIYLAYESGLIRKIDLSAADPQEVPFASLPQRPLGLATAGQYVFAVDPSGAWVSHYTFHPDGTMIESVDWNYRSTEYVWSEVNQKLYFFRDDTSPNDLLWEEINQDGVTYPNEAPGGIGAKKDSPLHSSNGIRHPIHVSPDGNLVILGSGLIHNADTLERLTISLANPIDDAAWLENKLYTAREIGGVTQYQRWEGASFEIAQTVQVDGTPHALLEVSDEHLLGITLDSTGVPQFTVLDDSIAPVSPPVGEFLLTSAPTEIIESSTSSVVVTIERTGDPAQPVTATLTSGDTSEFTGPQEVTFAAGVSSATVSLTVIDDDEADGRQNVELKATGTSYATGRTSIAVLDNEPVAIQSDGTTVVGEDGLADTIDIVLDAQPSANVVLSIEVSDDTEISVNKPTLVFTPENWDQVQTLAVTAFDDEISDGPQQFFVTVNVLQNSAAEYLAAAPVSVALTVLDNEPPRPFVTVSNDTAHDPSMELTWTPVEGAVDYDIWLSRAGDDTAPGRYTTVNTSYTGHGRLQVGWYYVWVRAKMQDGTYTPWGAGNFAVDEPINIDPLPFHGDSAAPEVTWSAVNGATRYQFWATNATTGQTGILNNSDLTTTAYQLPELQFGLHKFWVRALGPAGFRGQWSQVAQYYMGPNITTPELATLNSDPEFRWEGIAGASEYRIWISGPNGFLIDTEGITETSFTTPENLAAGRYRWWVLPKTANGEVGRWSPAGEITVGGSAYNLSVDAAENDSTPRLSWDAVGDAASYQVYLQRTDEPQLIANIKDLSANSFQTPLLADGSYRFWVRAYDESREAGWWSGYHEFTVDAVTSSLVATPILPTTPSLASEILFQWTNAQGAASYDLYLSSDNGVIEQVGLTTTSWSSSDLGRGKWDWQVRAVDSSGAAGPWSEPATVDTSGRPVFLTDGGNLGSGVPTIYWTAVEDADRYSLVVVDDATGESIIREDSLLTTGFTPTEALPAGTYRFWVKAISDSDLTQGRWSSPITIIVADSTESTESNQRQTEDSILAWLSLTTLSHSQSAVSESPRRVADQSSAATSHSSLLNDETASQNDQEKLLDEVIAEYDWQH